MAKPTEKTKPPHSFVSNVLYVLKDIYRSKKSLFAAIMISALCGSLMPLLTVYLPKTAIDLVQSSASVGEVLLRMGTYFAAIIAVSAIHGIADKTMDSSYYDFSMIYMRRVVSKSMQQNYGRLESEKGQNCYWKARDVANSGICNMADDIIALGMNLLNFLAFSYIISLLNPLIILFLIAMSFVTFAFMRRGSRIWESVREERSKLQKQFFVITEDGSSAKNGKEIRLYGMKKLFLEKARTVAVKSMQLYNKQRSGYIEEHFATIALDFLRDAAAYIYLILRTIRGGISAGDFVLYFGAITSFSGWVGKLNWQIDKLRRNYYDVNYFREFMEYEDPKIENPEKIKGSRPEIEFKNVSFSYDGKTNVLENFNLKIKQGEHIALVGVNGAGKSTIVKLLCGFYTPTSGSITIGGAEVTKVPPEERFEKISAVFQDMCILPHTLAENISMKEMNLTDKKRAAESLEKAGISKFVESLDSPVTKAVYDDGIEFSGGETQKLMMARAIYKDAPILILDEPTAALDPIAESETYERFHELSKGKIALYISHRLAGTRFCDRIVFLDGGEAKEIGTHEELLKKNGGYAKMFELQSKYYKDGGVDNEEPA